jgi:hypothetical protein
LFVSIDQLSTAEGILKTKQKTDLIRIVVFNEIQNFDYGRLSTSDAETGHDTKDTPRTMAGYHVNCQSAWSANWVKQKAGY